MAEWSFCTLSSRRFTLLLISLTTAVVVIYLTSTEALIRAEVDGKDLFSSHALVFHKARDHGSVNAAFGDSVVARGFAATDLDFVNLGLGGESPFRTAIKLKAFFRKNKPNKVILSASPNIWFIDDAVDTFDNYKRTFLNNDRAFLRISEPRNRYFSLDFWRQFIVDGQLSESTVVKEFGGFQQVDLLSEQLYAKKSAAEKSQDARNLINRQRRKELFINNNLNIFSNMIDFIKSHGGEVCLVSFPHSPSFTRELNSQDLFSTISANLWKELADNKNVIFIDLFQFFENDSYFMDFQHLNTVGAQILRTTILNECFSN